MRLPLLLLLFGCPPKDGDSETEPPDSAPSLTLDMPRNGEVYDEGEAVTVSGFTLDDLDAASALTVRVESSIDGAVAEINPGADGTFAIPITLTPGVHTVRVHTEDSAGNVATATVGITVEGDAVDDPPTVPTIHIEPATPMTGDTLTVVVDTPPVDPEGGAVAVAYRWTLAGVEISADASVDGAVRDDVWTVEVWGNDGTSDGEIATASVTVMNAPPTLTSVDVGPADATEDSPLTCTVSGAYDAEGDSIVSTYAWKVGGVVAGDGTDVLPAGTADEGEEVVCTVTLDDGFDTAEYSSDPFHFGNAAPSAPTVTIAPGSPSDTDSLECEGVATDPDGDPILYTFSWTVDGVATSYSTDTVPAADTHRDEVWECTVTGTDPGGLGASASASVTIGLAWAGTFTATDADVIIEGTAADGTFGKTIALVGDTDGDGLSELLVGANGENGSDGVVYLFSGSSLSGSLTTADAVGSWIGTYDEGQLGGLRAMAAPGDLDGDGYGDLLFAAGSADADGDGSGIAYLVYGGGAVSLGADPGDADWATTGAASQAAGARLAGGDLDGDGLPEVMVGAPGADAGEVAVYFGRGGRFSGSTTTADADWRVEGDADGDGLGWTTRMVGDVDGDGYDDAMFGAMNADGGGSDAGEIGLVLGGGGLAGTDAISDVAAAIFTGDAAGDHLGYDTVGDVDLDGDGTDDMLVAAYQDDAGAVDAGTVYVFLGRSSWASGYAPADADGTIAGTGPAARFGHVLATPGDLDSDGSVDVVIGALFASPGGLVSQGAASILLAPDWSATSVDTALPWTAMGESASDIFGDALSSGRGDVDGDGRDDFAVGAQGNDSGATSGGRVYVWMGR